VCVCVCVCVIIIIIIIIIIIKSLLSKVLVTRVKLLLYKVII